MEAAWTAAEFHQRMLALRQSYHLEHPLEARIANGQMTPKQLSMWVANRFYYQINIPRKDGAILANCPDPAFRRRWRQRIIDQDGERDGEGGIEAWLSLGEGTGLKREEMLDLRHVVPGVRFAVDAYLNFAKTQPWQEGVCASLTELFAPEAHRRRIEAFAKHYQYVPEDAVRYFKNRLTEARRDVDHGLTLTLAHFNTRPLQERALEIIQFKLDVLWGMAEGIYHAFISPGGAS